MPRKPINFELDFMIKDIFPRFTVKQFDDVSFNIKPKNQGLDYDTTGMIGKIFVGVNNDMFMQTDGISVSSNNINVLLDKNMLQKNGRAYAEIELTDKAGTITSSSFIFDIDPKIGEGGMIPGEYEGFVEKYERLIAEFKSQVNSSVNSANSLVNDAIKKCNTNIDNKLNTVDGLINAKILDIEKRFNNITTSKQQDAEVIDARDGEASLRARLDRDIEKAKEIYVPVEGTYVSTDSSVGYLKDVEIKGNTIQDAENLADIRSVGDKVEGQELYEIPVVSCGKNLFEGELELGSIGTTGVNNDYKGYSRSKGYIKVKPNTEYKAHGDVQFEYIFYYDRNKAFIRSSSTKNILTPINCTYVRFRFMSTNLENKFQLEEGNQATPYEPYQEDKLTILSPVQLEKVGDVRDRIICKDGVWGVEKNIGTFVLDGKEVWHIQKHANNTNVTSFSTKEAICEITGVDHLNILNSIFPPALVYGKNIPGTFISAHGNIWVSIPNENLDTLDVAGLNKYLNSNNMKVLVKSTNPQFIPLPHDQQIKLRTFAGQTNIHFETEIEGTIKAQVPKSIGATVNTHTEQIGNLSKELDRVKKIVDSSVGFRSVYIPIKSNSFVISNLDNTGKSFIAFYDSDKNYISRTGGQNQNSILATNIPNNACYFILTQYSFANETERNNSKNSIKPQLEYGLLETEYQPAKQDKKRILYYNPTTETWEKPILREWDSIEKHADGKYYYHKRSGELVLNGSEAWKLQNNPTPFYSFSINLGTTLNNPPAICDKLSIVPIVNSNNEVGMYLAGSVNQIRMRLDFENSIDVKTWLQANPTTVVYQLEQEEVYKCTNIDLITYANETNYVVNSGAIAPKSILKVHNNISNVVKILQEKVSLLESNVKAGQEVQDMMILETDMRMLDIELALMEHMPIKLNLGENTMLRSATYFNFLKNHIVNETYSKEYLENVMNKYLATGRINQDEYDELYKMLYPQNYDIALPIEE